MDDPFVVSGGERADDLLRDGASVGHAQSVWMARQPRGQRLSVDELHDNRAGRGVARLLEAVDRRDVGVIERGEEPGFTLEAGEAIRIGGEGRRKDLDRDVAFQARIARAIHFAHAAGTQECLDLIDADPGADSHRVEIIAARSAHRRCRSKS